MKLPSYSLLTSVAALGLLTSTTSAFSANIWDGGGANANWDTAANWDDDLVPASGADVTFLTENTSGSTILLNGNRTSGIVTFNNTDATSPTDTGFSGGVASVWTINTGISKTSSTPQSFTVNNSNLGIQLDSDGIYINHNATNGNLVINAPITGASSAVIRINDFMGGSPRAVRLGGNNTNFLGTWVVRRGTLSIDGSHSTALGASASNTITFQNVAGDGASIVTLNGGANVTWANNFVNNNASSAGGEAAQITFSGGASSVTTLNLTGSFTSGALQHASNRLFLNAAAGFSPLTYGEGRIFISGDWSAYNKGGASNGITLSDRGSVFIQNASALANSAVGYNIASTTTLTDTGGRPLSAKLILNDAITMNNAVSFSGTGGNMNSFGTRIASGTAILAGNLGMDDADGANIFSQNTGAVMRLNANITGSGPMSINDNYTISDGTATLTTATPTGTVEITRAAGVSYTGNITVAAGTLLVNNTSGSGTGTGTVLVNSGATLGGSGIIAGATTINGTLSPGNSPGTLTINNTLTLATTSILDWEINIADQTVGGGINDLVTGVTNLTLDGTINFTLIGGPAINTAGTWRLFNYSGTLTDNVLDIGSLNLASGFTASIDTTTVGQVNLSVIPEPSSAALLGLGLAGLAWLRRRSPNRQS